MQYDKPKLSVLVPVYNAEKYIAFTLKSILIQTYQNFEVLVCDDFSRDNSVAMINSVVDSKMRVFRNSSNLGKNKTVDFLLSQSTGEYITVHDADDISLPERLEKQMNFLLNNQDYALCGTNFISFLDSGKVIDKSNLERDSDQIRSKITKESQFHGPTIVFRKDILLKVGGFYRYFTRAEDIDFTMRVAEKFNTTNLREYLYLYRHVSTSLTNGLDGYDVERLGHAKLLYHLANERMRNNGIDTLMQGDLIKINFLINEFTTEYRGDVTIALRRGVFRLLAMHLYANAVKLSWRALYRDFKILNIKCFVYACLVSIVGTWKLFWLAEKVDLSFLSEKRN